MNKNNTPALALFKLSALCIAMAASTQVHASTPMGTGSVGDRVWYDSNQDGLQNDGEKGAPSITVTLNDCATGMELQSTRTDASGSYNLAYIDAGQRVRLQVYPDSNYDYDGAYFTAPREGTDTLIDSNGLEVTGATENTGASECFTVQAGVKTNAMDFGIYLSDATGSGPNVDEYGPKPQPNPPEDDDASIGDLVFYDLNENGIYDGNDTGIEGATVVLYNSSGATAGYQNTDSRGSFLVAVPAGCYTAALSLPGSIDPATVLFDATIDDICVSAGEVNRAIDFAVAEKEILANATIGDKVFYDNNNNGVYDYGDKGMQGAVVRAYDQSNALVNSATTSASGVFHMEIPPACYRVVMTLPTGVSTTNLSYNPTKNNVCVGPGQLNNNIDFSAYRNVPVPTWEIGACNRNNYHRNDSKGDSINFREHSRSNTADSWDVYDSRQRFMYNTNSLAEHIYGGRTFATRSNPWYQPVSGLPGYRVIYSHQESQNRRYNFMGSYYAVGIKNGQRSHMRTCASRPVSPVALDLNGDGQIGVTGKTTARDGSRESIGRTVDFDMNGDGQPQQMEWFSGDGDGILIDNRDGLAMRQMDGTRLFGDQNGRFGNGYEQMQLLDINGDQILSNAELSGLELWIDNGDAVVQAGEIQSLASHGVQLISTQMSMTNGMMRSNATHVDGHQILTEDVWFSVAPVAATAAAPQAQVVTAASALFAALMAALTTAGAALGVRSKVGLLKVKG